MVRQSNQEQAPNPITGEYLDYARNEHVVPTGGANANKYNLTTKITESGSGNYSKQSYRQSEPVPMPKPSEFGRISRIAKAQAGQGAGNILAHKDGDYNAATGQSTYGASIGQVGNAGSRRTRKEPQFTGKVTDVNVQRMAN